MLFLRAIVGVALVALVLAVAAMLWIRQPALEAIDTGTLTFTDEEIQHGTELAAVGNCIACHTVPGEPAFAGGLALPTPFGTIHSTNITPDPETGIGGWSEAAFLRALREGVDREGHYLYPAFPYDHFTLVTDEDSRALYAYLMTRAPVSAEPPANQLEFPYDQRPLMAFWNALFLDRGPFVPDPEQSEEWNRGAYLADGLGHCGACHTPRNRFGALDRDNKWGGGEAEGWTAYAINADSPAPVPWTRDAIAFYLRHGWHEDHGVSRGPMAEVTGNLAMLSDEDVTAIATYVAWVMGSDETGPTGGGAALAGVPPERGPGQSSDTQTLPGTVGGDRGADIFATTCASCHEAGRAMPYGGLSFRLSTAVQAPNPQNIVNVTLYGLPPADGEASAVMPPYHAVLSDADIVALLHYMRANFTDLPEWQGLEQMVSDTRSGAHQVTIRPADGIERGPENVGAEENP